MSKIEMHKNNVAHEMADDFTFMVFYNTTIWESKKMIYDVIKLEPKIEQYTKKIVPNHFIIINGLSEKHFKPHGLVCLTRFLQTNQNSSFS